MARVSSASARGRKTGQGRVLWGEVEDPLGVFELGGVGGKEGELGGGVAARTPPAQGQDAELVRAVDSGENTLPVLEVQQRGKLPLLDQVGEEGLVGVVGGDAGGHNHSCAAPLAHQRAAQLGES